MAEIPNKHPSTLAGYIDHLGKDTQNQLQRLKDFHVLSVYCYGRYSEMVQKGHIKEGVSFNSKSPSSAQDVAKLVMGYVDDDLPKVVVFQLVAHFEAFVYDLLWYLFVNNPAALPSKLTVRVDRLLKAQGNPDILAELVQQAQGTVKSHEWLAVIAKAGNIPVQPKNVIATLAELKATRDALAHNNGHADKRYLERAGNLARAKEGQALPFNRKYTYDSADFLHRLVGNIVKPIYQREVEQNTKVPGALQTPAQP